MPSIGWRRSLALLVGILILGVLIGYGSKAYMGNSRSLSLLSGEKGKHDVGIANAINGFSLAMFLRARTDENNLVVSPLSVFVALGVVSEGAAGQTQIELGKMLGISRLDSGFHERLGSVSQQMVHSVAGTGGQLNLANGVWIQKLSQSTISQRFMGAIRTRYEAEVREMDFRQSPKSVTRDINDWVSTKTCGKISELFSSGQITPATLMVIANAIYFKCPWLIQFRPELTYGRDFHRLDGSRIKVPMMTTSSDDYRYLEESELQILEMPYEGSVVSMVILLPGKRDGLAQLEKSLTPEGMTGWLGELAPHPGGVKVYLPRFSIRSRLGLVPVLKSMGMVHAFDTRKADFSRLFESPMRAVSISEIVHESLIDVNEEGTEAAAATGVGEVYAAGDRPVAKVFRADHPFMFMIIHKPTNCILFIGRVTDPRSKMN